MRSWLIEMPGRRERAIFYLANRLKCARQEGWLVQEIERIETQKAN